MVAPPLGFATLMGYGEEQHRFTLQGLPPSARLPTASTCFNTLKLPEYSSEAELAAKLRQSLGERTGFPEGAVAM